MLPSFPGISWSLSKQVLRNNNFITPQAMHRDMAKPAKVRTHSEMTLMSSAWGRENLTIYVLKIYCWTKTVLPTVRSAAANPELLGLQAGLLLPLPIYYYLLVIFFGCLALPSGCIAPCRFKWTGWVASPVSLHSCSSQLHSIHGRRSPSPFRNTFELCIPFLMVNFGWNIIDNIFWKSLNDDRRYQGAETRMHLV